MNFQRCVLEVSRLLNWLLVYLVLLLNLIYVTLVSALLQSRAKLCFIRLLCILVLPISTVLLVLRRLLQFRLSFLRGDLLSSLIFVKLTHDIFHLGFQIVFDCWGMRRGFVHHLRCPLLLSCQGILWGNTWSETPTVAVSPLFSLSWWFYIWLLDRLVFE